MRRSPPSPPSTVTDSTVLPLNGKRIVAAPSSISAKPLSTCIFAPRKPARHDRRLKSEPSRKRLRSIAAFRRRQNIFAVGIAERKESKIKIVRFRRTDDHRQRIGVTAVFAYGHDARRTSALGDQRSVFFHGNVGKFAAFHFFHAERIFFVARVGGRTSALSRVSFL